MPYIHNVLDVKFRHYLCFTTLLAIRIGLIYLLNYEIKFDKFTYIERCMLLIFLQQRSVLLFYVLQMECSMLYENSMITNSKIKILF